MLLYLYAIAASQAVWSFAYKWTTIADHPEYSLDKILSGAWPKPYAFRMLVRSAIDAATGLVPNEVAIPWVERSRQMLEATQGVSYAAMLDDRLALAYAIAMTSAFVFLVLSLFLLRKIGRLVFPVTPVSRLLLDIAPLLFALLLTITYRANNGFIYDHFELFIFLLYLYLVLAEQKVLALLALAFAIANKETAIFFPLFSAAMRLGMDRSWWRSGYVALIGEFMVVLIGFVGIRLLLRDHPGVTTEWHFFTNIDFWLSRQPWIAVTAPHSGLIPLPKPSNVVILGALLLVVFGYWKEKPNKIKWPLITTLLVNLPLFILFCWKDEYRNLSLTFPFVYMAAVHTMLKYFEGDRRAYE